MDISLPIFEYLVSAMANSTFRESVWKAYWVDMLVKGTEIPINW